MLLSVNIQHFAFIPLKEDLVSSRQYRNLSVELINAGDLHLLKIDTFFFTLKEVSCFFPNYKKIHSYWIIRILYNYVESLIHSPQQRIIIVGWTMRSQKISTPNPWDPQMLPCLEKRTLQMSLNEGSWDREIIMDYPGEQSMQLQVPLGEAGEIWYTEIWYTQKRRQQRIHGGRD